MNCKCPKCKCPNCGEVFAVEHNEYDPCREAWEKFQKCGDLHRIVQGTVFNWESFQFVWNLAKESK